MSEYALGEWEDGRRPLRDGRPMSDDEILDSLRSFDALKRGIESLERYSGKLNIIPGPRRMITMRCLCVRADELEALLKGGAL